MKKTVGHSIGEETQDIVSDVQNEESVQHTKSIRNKIQEASGIDDALWENAGLDMFVDFLQKTHVDNIEEYLSVFFSRFKKFVLESQRKLLFPWFKESFFPNCSRVHFLMQYLYTAGDQTREVNKGLAYIPFEDSIKEFLKGEGILAIEEYSAVIFKIISTSNYSSSHLDYFKRSIHSLLGEYPVLEDLKKFAVGWKDSMNSFNLCNLFEDHKNNSQLHMTKEERELIVTMAKNIENNIGYYFHPLISRFGSSYLVEGAADDAYDHWNNILTYPQLFQTMRLYEKVSDLEVIKTNKLSISTIREIVDIYCRIKGGITSNIVDGIIENLLPLIASNSEAPKIIIDRLNDYEQQSYFPRNRGKFFFEKPRKDLLDIITTPLESSFYINKSLIKIKQIPTLDINNHEQNRKDALFVSDRSTSTFIDFVHRQDPMVHDFISKMIQYYDTKTLYDESSGDKKKLEGDMENLEDEISKMQNKNQHLRSIRYSYLLDLLFGENWSNAEQRKIKNIEIFRRLEKNTRTVPNIPNDTIDPKLLLLIKKCELDPSNFNDATSIIRYLNQKLMSYIATQKVGIDINELVCINRIDHKLAGFLDDPKFNTLVFLKSKSFFEIFKFLWITNSVTFSENEFEQFKQKIQQTNKLSDIKRIIRETFYQNIYDLATKHKTGGMDETNVLWSGNLAYKIVELVNSPSNYNESHWERFNDPHKDDDGMI